MASLYAHAGDLSIGAGVGAAHGRTDCVDAFACRHGSTDAKLSLGYRLRNGIELEAVAFDAGRFKGGDTTPLGTPFGGRFEVSGVGLAAGYRWSFMPGWSLRGQLGMASVRTRFDDDAPFEGTSRKTTTQPLAGLSLTYAVTPNWQLSLDGDATRFKVYTTSGSLRTLCVTAQYTF